MDSSEKMVNQYLQGLGFADVRYEPDGNIPPDFLVDGRIAVEVRRLNQNYDEGSRKGPRGLEETAIPLWRHVWDHVTGLGPAPSSGQSWCVYYRFSRPTPTWRDLKRELDRLLKPFMANPDPQPFDITLLGHFRVEVIASPVPQPTFFRPLGYHDVQSGGWLLGEIETNLRHCIAEKTAKIANHRARYPEWWLVLPDYIGYGLNESERELIYDQTTLHPGGFDKIVLIDLRDVSRAFHVYPRQFRNR